MVAAGGNSGKSNTNIIHVIVIQIIVIAIMGR
jgi:hypothetical protein